MRNTVSTLPVVPVSYHPPMMSCSPYLWLKSSSLVVVVVVVVFFVVVSDLVVQLAALLVLVVPIERIEEKLVAAEHSSFAVVP